MELNSLDAKQLKKVISDASTALSRRQKIEKAMAEFHRVSKKFKLTEDELKTVLVSFQSAITVSAGKPKSVRAKVKPKYKSEDGKKNWTGRGRSPSWVVEICRSNGLTIEGFKTDQRFLIQRSTPKKSR